MNRVGFIGVFSLKQFIKFHYLASWTGCLLLNLSFKQGVNIWDPQSTSEIPFIIIIIILI